MAEGICGVVNRCLLDPAAQGCQYFPNEKVALGMALLAGAAITGRLVKGLAEHREYSTETWVCRLDAKPASSALVRCPDREAIASANKGLVEHRLASFLAVSNVH